MLPVHSRSYTRGARQGQALTSPPRGTTTTGLTLPGAPASPGRGSPSPQPAAAQPRTYFFLCSIFFSRFLEPQAGAELRSALQQGSPTTATAARPLRHMAATAGPGLRAPAPREARRHTAPPRWGDHGLLLGRAVWAGGGLVFVTGGWVWGFLWWWQRGGCGCAGIWEGTRPKQTDRRDLLCHIASRSAIKERILGRIQSDGISLPQKTVVHGELCFAEVAEDLPADGKKRMNSLVCFTSTHSFCFYLVNCLDLNPWVLSLLPLWSSSPSYLRKESERLCGAALPACQG